MIKSFVKAFVIVTAFKDTYQYLIWIITHLALSAALAGFSIVSTNIITSASEEC
jgi:hypothetical protein